MKSALGVFATMFLIGLFPVHISAATTCAEKKERVSHVFMKTAGALRHRMEEVDREQLLSEETRSDFHWDAEWIIAWFTDQVERLEAKEGCEEVASIVEAARAQFDPVQLKSRKIRASVILWHLDRVLLDLEKGEARALLAEARSFFADASQAKTHVELRGLLQRAAFLTHQGLRSLRNSAIIDRNEENSS